MKTLQHFTQTKATFTGMLACLLTLFLPNLLLAQTKTFSFTGAVETFTVPNGINSVEITAIGGDGGNGITKLGGSGAKATATFPVTPGTVLEIVIGGAGESTVSNKLGESSGGGGGGTGVRIQGASLPLIVAGGGAGAGKRNSAESTNGNGGVATAGTGQGGDEGGFNSSGGGGGLLSDGMTNTDGGTTAGEGGKGGFGAAGGMAAVGSGRGGFGVGGGGGGGSSNFGGGGGGGGYTGGDASLSNSKTPSFSNGGGSFISPSATSFRTTAASARSMPIIPGNAGGAANPPVNGMLMFTLNRPSAIPTFNQWGLLIFGLLVLNLGLLFIRKTTIPFLNRKAFHKK